MRKKYSALFFIFLFLSCGGGSGESTDSPGGGGSGNSTMGTWSGGVNGVEVTVHVNEQLADGSGTYALTGIMETDGKSCFDSGYMTGNLVNNVVDFISIGSGISCSNNIVKINGNVNGNVINGLFSMNGLCEDCDIDDTNIVLVR